MQPTASFFSDLNVNDLWFLVEAALNTVYISILAIVFGTLGGVFFGWLMSEYRKFSLFVISPILDVFRSIPLIIQLVLFFNFAPIVGFILSPFIAGLIVLSFYTTAYVANVVYAGILSVNRGMIHASRSLGMSYWQSMRFIVFPIGVRTVFASWAGIALGIIKDSALVSVLGYVELLKASQILITRTQDALLILSIAGAFYFIISYPLSHWAQSLEERWKN